MAEVTIVQGLTGSEIIEDLVNQIRNKLRRDCNLRETDSYSRGYSAKVSYKLELYGMDVTTVEAEDTQINPAQPEDADKVVSEGAVEVQQETELNEVRERSSLEEPILTSDAEGRPEVRKRKYSRRVVATAAPEIPEGIGGGAEAFVE